MAKGDGRNWWQGRRKGEGYGAFPYNVDYFKRKKDDGRADAALIACWGLRHG